MSDNNNGNEKHPLLVILDGLMAIPALIFFGAILVGVLWAWLKFTAIFFGF